MMDKREQQIALLGQLNAEKRERKRMVEPIFHYRISVDAGMANDGKGNPTSCYTKVELKGANIKPENYDEVHERLKELIEEQTGIKVAHLECVSAEEYDENHEEEEE